MRQKLLSPSFFRASPTVQIGWLVTNPFEPHQDFFAVAVEPSQIQPSPLEDYREMLDAASATTFGVKIIELLSAGLGAAGRDFVDLKSKYAKSYVLLNSTDIFDTKVVTDLAAQAWMEKAIRRGLPVYFLVGYYTLQDTTVVQDSGSAGRGHAQAGPSPAATGQAPISGHIKHGAAVVHERSFLAPGEQVYTVQYRRVGFGFLGKKEAKDAVLKGGKPWKVQLQDRGEDEDDEDDEMIEAGLEDDGDDQALKAKAKDTFVFKDDMYLL
jgi:hypothetical protein